MLKREIFLEAGKLPPGAERNRFLAKACGNDEKLRAQIEGLLSHDIDDEFLEDPAVDERVVLAAPEKRIGRYSLLEEIGRGGMGTVYLAEQLLPVSRKVALKVISPGMDTRQVIARFETERQTLARMDHPNIARILDAGATPSGLPYFVMELVRGSVITRFCDEHRVGMRERLELFLDVCAAVEHAHQKGIIHRDLKPGNILVTMAGDQPLVKVIDFGVAKAVEQGPTDLVGNTRHLQCVGTPAYMSPEQAQSKPAGIDTRSDIYALGVLLYELLTGALPFDVERLTSEGRDAYLRAIRDDVPPTPSSRFSRLALAQQVVTGRRRSVAPERLRRLLRGDLDWIVMKALEKDRRRRYDTARDLAQDVRRYLAREPVSAAAPSKLYILRRFVDRHRVAVSAAGLVVAALLIGLTLSLYFYSWERHAREIAEEETEAAVNARKEADRHRLAVEKLLYASDLREALEALREGDAGKARRLYAAHSSDHELLGWEWRLLHGRLGRERVRIDRYAKCSELAVSRDGRLIAVAATHSGLENEPRVHTIDVLDARSFEVLDRFEYTGWYGWTGGMRFTPDGTDLILDCSWNLGSFRIDLDTHRRRQLLRVNPAGFWPTRLTPDERWIVGMYDPPGGGRRYLRCFDSHSGEELRRSETFEPPDGSMICHEVRVSPDGLRVTVSCQDRTLRIYSIPDLERMERIAVPGDVSCVAWSPDSRVLATGYDATRDVDLWQIPGGTRLRTLRGRQAGGAVDLCFSPDGSLLAHSMLSGYTILWDPKTGIERRVFPDQGGGGALALAFTADGTSLLSCKDYLKAWDVAGRDDGDESPISNSQGVLNIEYSPDGQTLAAIAAEGKVLLFDARTGALTGILEPPKAPRPGRKKHPDEPLCFYPDGSHLVASNGDGTATVHDLHGDSPPLLLVDPENELGSLTTISVSPASDMIATAGTRYTLTLWDARTGTPRTRFPESGGRFVAFSPARGSRLLAFASRSRLTLLDLDDGRRTDRDTRWYPTSLTFSPDGKTLMSGYLGELILRDVATLEPVARQETEHDRIHCVAFCAGDPTIAVPIGGVVHLWNRAVRAFVGQLDFGGEEPLLSASFSPDGNRLAVSTFEEGIRIFEAPSRETIVREQLLLSTRAYRLKALAEGVMRSTREEREREFARDPGAVKEWLLLTSLPVDPDDGLDHDPLGAAGPLRPRPGETASLGGRSYPWRAHRQADYVLNLSKLVASERESSAQVAYAVSYLISDQDRDGVRMLVGGRGTSLVSLNGRELRRVANDSRFFRSRQFYRDGDIVESLSLNAGVNTLVVKTLSESGPWVISVRLTDREGNPLQNVRTTLDPD